jgi:hypothetical protein
MIGDSICLVLEPVREKKSDPSMNGGINLIEACL